MRAALDFACIDPDCQAAVQCNVMALEAADGRVTCPQCRREYVFESDFRAKFLRLRSLILALREAEDILGDASVAVTTPAGEVKIPYRLLLTRLNTIITLEIEGKKIDFHFRVEPLRESSFR